MPEWMKNALLAVFAVVVLTGAAVAVKGGGQTGARDAETVVRVAPATPVVNALFVGDSYTAGTGATSPSAGEACLTAVALHWRCDLDAQGGTGFIANGQGADRSLLNRLSLDTSLYRSVDVVVVDAGRNDHSFAPAAVERAESDYLFRLHAAYPKAKIVLVLPYYMTDSTSELGSEYVDYVKGLAGDYRAVVIDPLGEGWINRDITGSLTIPDRIHPNEVGHRYIARHLVADLRSLLG